MERSLFMKETIKVRILSVLMNKNDIFYKNHRPATFCLFDISAAQNLKQSEVKPFRQIINYDLFQYLKII